MIVADTNVVSEFMRDDPDARVSAWAQQIGAADLGITVVTVEEIERGLGRLRPSRRLADLSRRWRRLIDQYASNVLVYDVEAAQSAARILVLREAAGRPMGLADAQIAGICQAGGHDLASRNVRDFAGIPDLPVIDPFS